MDSLNQKTTSIRRLEAEEFIHIWPKLGGYAFRPSPPLDKHEDFKFIFYMQDVTSLVLYEDEKPVTAANCSPMQQNVRGRLLQSGGIWGIVTHPAARRKGYARETLRALFASIRDQGMPVTCLYPFRESFYERMGFVPFPQARKVRFDPRNLVPLFKVDLPGEVEVLPVKEGFSAYYDYLYQRQKTLHGMGIFAEDTIGFIRDSNELWVAIARVDGEPVGTMLYRIHGELDSFEMDATRFYYSTSAGLYLLLEWFARHADHAQIAQIKLPPFERPETWFPDVDIEGGNFEPPMGRVVDVTGLEGIKTGPGRFSAQIIDPDCPWNNGSYAFETIDGELQVSPTSDADCELTINGLSALVYGTMDPMHFYIRGWSDAEEGVVETMRRMFPVMSPYLHETY